MAMPVWGNSMSQLVSAFGFARMVGLSTPLPSWRFFSITNHQSVWIG